jgi:hypothetical protein
MTGTVGEQVAAVLAELTPAERKMAQPRVDALLKRREAINRFPTPGHLAQFLNRGTVQTPLLDKLDEAVAQAWMGLQRRWIINTPPQEGKTTRISQVAMLWLLIRDPSLRIAVASYEQGIATQSTLAVRQAIEQHGRGYKGQRPDPDRVDVLGLTLDPDRAMNTNWVLADIPGRRGAGGMISVGVGSAFTGRPADVLIVDDPLKDAKQADSPLYRQRVKDWFQAVASARLSGRAIVIIIQTRWHEDDLAGWLIKEDDLAPSPEYGRINIPAQALENDPLGRAPGEWLISARARTIREWEAKPRQIGSRWWQALYQGSPSAPEGGTFKRAWFDSARVSAAPEMAAIGTMVDPADNTGTGDEAGIMTGGIGSDSQYYLLADDSGHYTAGQWMRKAIYAACRRGSGWIGWERSLSGLRRTYRETWKAVRKQARLLDGAWAHIAAADDPWPVRPVAAVVEAVAGALVDEEDSASEKLARDEQLREMWPWVPTILSLPRETGFPIRIVNPIVNKRLRAEIMSPLVEELLVHHVGHFMTLEHQACTWLPSQDSPDRMDAWVHLITELSRSGKGSFTPAPRATTSTGASTGTAIETSAHRTVRRAPMGARISTRPGG